jgi:uroporphyrinogen decarboxylase
MSRDNMTSVERTTALFKGEELDRVPVVPFMTAHYAVVNGIPIADIFSSAEKSFAAQTRGRELYCMDGYNMYGYAMYGGWEFGGEIVWPGKDGQAPLVKKYPVKNEEEAMKLELPDDILNAGSVPIGLEFARIAARQGTAVPVMANGGLSMASCIVGIENLMMWLITSPEVVHHVVRKCTDFTLYLINYWAKEFGAENMIAFMGTATESNGLISPQHFEEFALPYIKETAEKLTEIGVNKCLMHICADQKRNLPGYSKIKWPKRTIFSTGTEITIKETADAFPGHIVGGQVDTLLLNRGKPEKILESCRQLIEEANRLQLQGSFALMPACDVPAYAPSVNVYQMAKAAREYGQY